MNLFYWFMHGNSLRASRILLFSIFGVTLLCTVADCGEGRQGIKCKLMFEGYLKAVDRWLNRGSYALKRALTHLIKYETRRTCFGLAGEDFQNIGAFIVARISVFAISSEQASPLARDAYNALWNSRRWRQQEISALELREERWF